jgi:hypothetical protein
MTRAETGGFAENVELDLALPGLKINAAPDDYRVNKQLQMMKFNGERWELFGPSWKMQVRRASG